MGLQGEGRRLIPKKQFIFLNLNMLIYLDPSFHILYLLNHVYGLLIFCCGINVLAFLKLLRQIIVLIWLEMMPFET